jgi:hypothetical protein
MDRPSHLEGYAVTGITDAAELARLASKRPDGEFIPTVVVSPLLQGAFVLELLFTDDHLHEVGERLGRICLSRFHACCRNQAYTNGMVDGLVEMYAVSEVPRLHEWRRVRIRGPRKRKLPYKPVVVMSYRPIIRDFDQIAGWRNGYAFRGPYTSAILEAQRIIRRGR